MRDFNEWNEIYDLLKTEEAAMKNFDIIEINSPTITTKPYMYVDIDNPTKEQIDCLIGILKTSDVLYVSLGCKESV